MRRVDFWTGVILAAFGLVSIFAIIPAQIAPGPDGYMSPRLVPTMMMTLITGLAVLIILKNIHADEDTAGSPLFTGAEIFAVVKLSAVFAIALTLYRFTTPLFAGIALVTGALLVLGERRIHVILGMPAILMLLIWLLFYKLLGTAIM